jgi:hypothetical protein
MAFFDSSLLRGHFRPFIEVLRKIFGSLTREPSEFLLTPRITRMSLIRRVVAAVRLSWKSGRQHAWSRRDHFGEREATIFSKHGSPHSGLDFGSNVLLTG